MDTNHSPGPFTLILEDDRGHYGIAPGDAPRIAHVWDRDEARALANAELFAAAPNLLKASVAAWHLCQSLLATREAPTDDLLREVSGALLEAITDAGAKP